MPGFERERPERDEALKELGRMAAERREEIHMTLEDIYDRTRIRTEYLMGIEEGNYTGFPEPVYVKGFIRTYLRLIGAEDLQDDFMAQLNRVQPQKEPATNLMGNGSFPKGFKPASHLWLFLVLLAALIGTGSYVWYAVAHGKIDLSDFKWPALTRGNGAASRDERQDAALLSLDVQPASMDILTASADPGPKPPEKPKLYLEIRAVNSDVWLQVTIGSNTVYSQTLRQGSHISWDLPAQARVRFGRGNVGQVILNGKDLGIVKEKGTYLYLPDGTSRRAGAASR